MGIVSVMLEDMFRKDGFDILLELSMGLLSWFGILGFAILLLAE
jgi:hypothetical protein